MTKEIDKKTLLIFSAHPDDHLGCAGTAMKLKKLGFKIVEVAFTGGEKSVDLTQKSKKPVDKKQLISKRKKEFEKASKIMGTDKSIFLGLPNNNIQRTPELIEILIKIIREEKPTIVISESPNDYHIDHRAIGKIVPEAVDRAGWGVSKELGERFVTPVGLFMGSKLEAKRMDILIDITKFIERKNRMLEAYESQMGTLGSQLTLSIDGYCGFKLRTKAAESFDLMTDIPVKLDALLEILGGKQNERTKR